ncbi:MAG: undecaprenyl-diphosphate phosphatase [Micrococcales bacterium]
MDFLNAMLLGLIQGLTEFLPISSSAHVQIFEQLLPLGTVTGPSQLTAFIATIQLGTEAAVLVYFWKDIIRIAGAWFKSLRQPTRPSKEAKLGWLIIVGSIPVVIIGLAFQNFIENQLRNLWVVGVTLIVFGLLLGFADRAGQRSKSLDEMTTKQGLAFGLGQALAVIPGVSRSGGTITVGLLMGFTRQAAARYSFLLAIPAVLASGLYEFAKTYKNLPSEALAGTALATVVAFFVGLAVIAGLLKYLNKGSFLPFVIWRVVLGTAVLVALANGMLVAA